MNQSPDRGAVAIVGLGAVLPDAPNVSSFWQNLRQGRYSITETPPERWNTELYYDADPKAADKTYSKIGGWVRDFAWKPFDWKMPIPPKVGDAMDRTQKWALAAAYEALADFGVPERELDRERTAVILGNAMAGDKHYMTALRILAPEYLEAMRSSSSFAELPADLQERIAVQALENTRNRLPDITEDTMPGELGNIIAGRVAAVFDLHGPNFVTDAACASAMAAMSAAIEGLDEHHFDVAVTGGIDANMSASTFVKFCKIGALSATGTRPYDVGADGFVMGEGAAVFIMKRLGDAERDGDKIYAVLRSVGGASDGKGKGITAPNPVGQRLAITRGWELAGEAPDDATYIEGHGTSTRVGDVVETESLREVFSKFSLRPGTIPLGSVKSNIGHLKGAAGAAGILKATLALHHGEIPPSLNVETPNPKANFPESPLFPNRELRPWATPSGRVRRAGVSAFGFGGTNFHAVLEEHIPGRLARTEPSVSVTAAIEPKSPLRPIWAAGASSRAGLVEALSGSGSSTSPINGQAVRIAIDHADAEELKRKQALAEKALRSNNPAALKPLRAQGVFVGEGPRPKVAFLYTGQGSQYVNMLRELRERQPVVAETFAEADDVMTPILGRSLSSLIFVDESDETAMRQANEQLRQTEITQPAVLTVDIALTRLLGQYGIEPDMVMGHSLGEYGALVAAGGLDFAHSLEAVAARGKEMTKVSVGDKGKMAAVMGSLEAIEEIVRSVDGYVVVANLNSRKQAVIGGASEAVERTVQACLEKGFQAQLIPVSHAFHTSIVAPASGPLMEVLRRLSVRPIEIPLVGNVHGEFYPTGPGAREQMIELLGRQVASPVHFVKGLETLYEAGARVFVEVGPKKALHGFAEEVLGDRADALPLFTNHPKLGDVPSFNQALAGLKSRGFFTEAPSTVGAPYAVRSTPSAGNGAEAATLARPAVPALAQPAPTQPVLPAPGASTPGSIGSIGEIGQLFSRFMEDAFRVMGGGGGVSPDPIVISGAGLGLPGGGSVFSDETVSRLLAGEGGITSVPDDIRQQMVDHHIERLVKGADGSGSFEKIEDQAHGIKLAGQAARFSLVEEFGYPADRLAALDSTTQLAIAAGVEALRDAGIPLVMHYKTTTRKTFLPERWMLPEELRDDTGVIFGSAFPGLDAYAQEAEAFRRYEEARAVRDELTRIRARLGPDADSGLVADIDARLRELDAKAEDYVLDRRFLFRVLAMGHSQFAEYIGARGPNTHVNAACASGTQGIGIAEDWIRTGRCRRVIVLSSDNVTSPTLMPWIGSGFLASGAAATDARVEDAALPFDRRRHGLVLGMGAAAVVVEEASAVAERGLRPIASVMATRFVNSAFHGTRLDPGHITQEVEALVAEAERKFGIPRAVMAERMVFISHETYTPARGGSAQTEVQALRTVFGPSADAIVVANTKGMTGHAMGTGIEDVLGVKALETGVIPPVPNFREVDPELGRLNLSQGGAYPIEFALRLGAGFGSQLALSLIRWVPSPDGTRPHPSATGYPSRIADEQRWNHWVEVVSGHAGAELEVVKRTLRVRDMGPADAAVKAALRAAEPPAAVTPHHPAAFVPVTPTAAPTPAYGAPAATTSRPAASVPVSPPVETRAAPTTSATAVPTSSSATGAVEARILEIVAAQTGYPPDMLDTELDLEADLGIDTVKQAEMFAAVRESYGIERDPDLQLRDFNTLRKVVGFVHAKRPDLAVAAPAAPASPPASAPATVTAGEAAVAETSAVEARILEIVAEQTGYPSDMLDPDLDLEADLGIDTVKQAEMFAAVRESYGIERDADLQLRDFNTLKKVVGFVYDKRPDLQHGTSAAVAPASTASPESAPAASSGGGAATGTDAVEQRILEIVAEQTGYPPDMIDPELDLEADLGIDTVKQAEMFAAVRESYGIERDPDLQLRDFNTLKKVVGFVYGKRPELQESAPAVDPSVPSGPPLASAASGGADPGTGTDAVEQRILEIVAEQTGYPPDMIDPELDLEADLGIDTVKQAEMFAAVRESYGIERDPDLQLRDFNTLRKVVGFVYAKRPSVAAPAASETEPLIEAASLEATTEVARRVPTPVLRFALDRMAETQVKLGSDARVLVMPDQGGVATALVSDLERRGVEVCVLEPSANAERLEAQLDAWVAERPFTGVYWLAALDSEGPLTELAIGDFRGATWVRVKALHRTMRKLYEQIVEPSTFLVSATRLGGQFGIDGTGASAPLGGAVSGFTKAYGRERPEALVKVVDFPGDAGPDRCAAALVDETLRDPGVVEVGRPGDDRITLRLTEIPPDDEPGLSLEPGTVFVVTGAAGGITSEIVSDLAAGCPGGVFHLLDLAEAPREDDPDLAAFVQDREALKRTLFERLRASGEKATPVAVERWLGRLERGAAALKAIRAVRASGGTAHYHALDLRDHAAVKEVVQSIGESEGRIDVIVHAGGLEISRFLPDKSPEEFELVFDVKAQGWMSLWSAVARYQPRATVSFGSIAGRFGNAGQTDYSAANDFLAKAAAALRPAGVRAIVLDWTAWAGIGMATRGSIPQMMARAGIDMLAPEVGIPFVRRELTVGSRSDEVVVGGRLGVLEEERHPRGGLAEERPRAIGPMIETLVGDFVQTGLTGEVTLDPRQTPFLDHHRIDGTPVLPGVMGMESFVELARAAFPGAAAQLEEVEFLAPFKFYRDEPRTVTVRGSFAKDGDDVLARCELVGSRQLPGQETPRTTVHFRGTVRLTEGQPPLGREDLPLGGAAIEAGDIYEVYFHGPTYQVVSSVRQAGPATVGVWAEGLPPNHEGGAAAFVPRLVELCFQTAGVAEIAREHTLGLPAAVRRVRWTQGLHAEPEGLHAVVRRGDDGTTNAYVIDATGEVIVEVDGYRTVVLPQELPAERVRPFDAIGG